jgi:ribosomal protein L4
MRDVKVTQPGGMSVYDLFAYRHLLITREALEKVVEVWGK